MEGRLKLTADILEIVLNFLVMMCAETAADAVSGGLFRLNFYAPVYVLVLPVLAPLIFYAVRKRINNLALFLAIHMIVIAALFSLPGFFAAYLSGAFPAILLWKLVYLAVGILYGIHSIRIRLTRSEDGEGEMEPLFAGCIAAAAFFVCSRVKSDVCCTRILWIALFWISGYWIKNYLDHFLAYMELNRKTAGVMPERRILQGGMALTGGYAGISLIVLAMCSQTSFVERLSDMIRKAGYSLLRLFFALLAKLAWEPEEGPAVTENTDAAMQMVPGEGSTEPSLLAQALERIVTVAVLLLLAAGVVFLLIQAVRFMIRRFYGRKSGKKEIRQEGFVEEEERLKDGESRTKERLPVIGGTPAQRVRRIFKRTVREMAPKREKDAFAAKTARELADIYTGPDTETWMAFASLYERARYTQQTITRQEVKEAGKLSRQIMHTIK